MARLRGVSAPRVFRVPLPERDRPGGKEAALCGTVYSLPCRTRPLGGGRLGILLSKKNGLGLQPGCKVPGCQELVWGVLALPWLPAALTDHGCGKLCSTAPTRPQNSHRSRGLGSAALTQAAALAARSGERQPGEGSPGRGMLPPTSATFLVRPGSQGLHGSYTVPRGMGGRSPGPREGLSSLAGPPGSSFETGCPFHL